MCAAPYYNDNEFAGVAGIGCDITTWYNLLVKTVVSEGRTCFILWYAFKKLRKVGLFVADTVNEKKYLDSLFYSISIDSAPIKNKFEKFFVAKNMKITIEISKEQRFQVCKRFGCSEEKFFMSAYGLLLARFAGSDEVFFTATDMKKIPVSLNLSPEQSIADYLKNLSEQIERSREIISTPYEEIAKNRCS